MSQSRRDVNPFPGLRPFETEEYLLFFGREGQSDELLARLGRTRFLAVVGTSGSGKSSLVRAGLLPAMRGGLMKGAGSGWRIAVMRPGHDPVGNLACALAAKDVLAEAGAGLHGAEAEAVIEATLRSGSLGLVDAARQARLGEHENLLVVVDQFEELFRFRAARAGTGDRAAAFVKLILEAARQRELSIYVVITMRSDFLGDCAQFQGLPEAINDGQYLIPRMTRDERRVAITGPVAVARGRVAEPLVSRLLNDVGDNPDQLPILQHALMRTWDYWKRYRRDGEPIGVEHYEATGTMSAALSLHAEEAWDELPDERSREIAEKMFRALTEKGADNRETRRPTRLREIAEIAGASEAEVVAVIDTFRRAGRSFLMPPVGVELTGEVIIDISHESLIRNWQRLKEWVADEAQSARTYRRLAEAAVLHREGSEGLAQDPALQIALDWRERSRPNAAWGQHYHPEFDLAMAYLEASREARDAAVAERERQRQEEIERERRQRDVAQRYAAQQARSARRMRRLTFAMILLACLSAGTAVYALRARAAAHTALGLAEESQKKAEESERHAVALKGAAERSLESEKAARRELQAQTEAVKRSEEEARRSAEAATRANEQTKLALARANEQTAIAAENLKKAEAARREAVESEREQLAAAERSETFRKGIENLRREEFEKAREEFDKLRKELEALKPNAAAKPEKAQMYATELGRALSKIGSTYQRTGKFPEAISSYQEALNTFPQDYQESTLLETYHGLGQSYHAVATNYQGDGHEAFENAEKFLKDALKFQETHRKDRPGEVAAGYLNLARLYADRGWYDMDHRWFDKAEKHFQKAAELRGRGRESSQLGKNERAGLTAALRALAEFYRGQKGREEEALKVFDEMVVLQEDGSVEALAGRAPELVNIYSDIGQIYAARADAARADAASADAASATAVAVGTAALDTDEARRKADATAARAAALHNREKLESALRLANIFQRVAVKMRQMGNNPQMTSTLGDSLAADLDELSDAYASEGKLDAAEKVFKGALAYRTEATEESYVKLWMFYSAVKPVAAEAERYRKLMESSGDKPRLAGLLYQFANTYGKKRAWAGAAELAYEYALSFFKGKDWMHENRILYQLDDLHNRQRQAAKREAAAQRRLDVLTDCFKRLSGASPCLPSHPAVLVSEYLNASERAGIIYNQSDKLAEAEAALSGPFQAVEFITSTRPNPKTMVAFASTLKRYEMLLTKRGKLEQAEAVRKKWCQLDEPCRKQAEQGRQEREGPSPTPTPE